MNKCNCMFCSTDTSQKNRVCIRLSVIVVLAIAIFCYGYDDLILWIGG